MTPRHRVVVESPTGKSKSESPTGKSDSKSESLSGESKSYDTDRDPNDINSVDYNITCFAGASIPPPKITGAAPPISNGPFHQGFANPYTANGESPQH